MARYRDRIAALTYPEAAGWPEFTRLTAQHADLQTRYRDTAGEADRLDRTRDTALDKDREAYAQALLDGKADPGQKHTQAHDKKAADKRRERDALRVAVQRTEDTIQDLLETEGTDRVASLDADLTEGREKAQALLADLATRLSTIQENRAVAAWVRKALRDGHATSYRPATAGTTGWAEGLKRANGEDHTLADVFAALDRTLQPPAPAEPRRPGAHVPPDQQNWGQVGAALTSGGAA